MVNNRAAAATDVRHDCLRDVEALSHPHKRRRCHDAAEVAASSREGRVVLKGTPRQRHLEEVLGQRQEQRWRSSRRPPGDSRPNAAEARYGRAHDADHEIEGRTRRRGHVPRRSPETLK